MVIPGFLPIQTLFHVVPATCVGLDRSILSLSPNWPRELYPHDHKVPSVLVAKI